MVKKISFKVSHQNMNSEFKQFRFNRDKQKQPQAFLPLNVVCFIWIYYCGTETQDPLSFCLTEAPASGNNFHKNPGRSLWEPERFSLRKTKKHFAFSKSNPNPGVPVKTLRTSKRKTVSRKQHHGTRAQPEQTSLIQRSL